MVENRAGQPQIIQPEAVQEEPPELSFDLPLVELTMFFRPEDMEQMEQDAIFLAHKRMLNLEPGADRVTRLETLIRFACHHVHRSIQKMLASDLEVVDQVKKTLSEVMELKNRVSQRERQLEQMEMQAAEKLTEAQRLVNKYVQLLPREMLEDDGEMEERA